MVQESTGPNDGAVSQNYNMLIPALKRQLRNNYLGLQDLSTRSIEAASVGNGRSVCTRQSGDGASLGGGRDAGHESENRRDEGQDDRRHDDDDAELDIES